MELDKAETEEQEFENVRVVRSNKKDKEGHYSAALEGSKQAISKTIKVKKGDRIKASVFATHDPIIAETDPTKAIEEAKKDVLLSLGAAAAGVVNINPTQQKIEIPVNPEISPATTQTIESPKVQLNLLDFIPVIRNLRALNRAKKAKGLEPDMYFVPKGELVLELRDSTDSLIFEKREKLTISSAVSWEKLMSNLEIKEDGNLSVYIDNSSSDKVYFDEFIIERTEATVAVVVQENHYYPFGMNMKGIEELDSQSLDGTDEHRWQFNGVEKNESFDLNWNETFYRTYDYQLGRWNAVDSKPTYEHTTYMGMGNNPMKYSDVLGDTVDVSSFSEKDLLAYNKQIEKLSNNKMFKVYYKALQESENTYIVKAGQGHGGSGSFNSKTGEVHVKLDNAYAISQELFHAFQSDIGVYSGKDLSVREAEGDIVSGSISLSLGEVTPAESWSGDIGFTYVDDDLNFNQSVFSEEFDADFNKAVDDRIDFYKQREATSGAKAPATYIQKNSEVGALALKRIITIINQEEE